VERETSCAAKEYLTSPAVAKILKVSGDTLDTIVESGVIRPLREPMLNGMKLWRPDDIFRAYLTICLKKEFVKKYGREYNELMLDEIKRDILSVKRIRGKEIRQSRAWADVVERAAEKGLVI